MPSAQAASGPHRPRNSKEQWSHPLLLLGLLPEKAVGKKTKHSVALLWLQRTAVLRKKPTFCWCYTCRHDKYRGFLMRMDHEFQRAMRRRLCIFEGKSILECTYHSLKSESYSQRLTHFLLAVIHQRFSVYNFKKCCYNPIRSTESILNNKFVHT